MWILIVLFVLLFLLLLLSLPLIVEARGRTGLRGAAIRARIFLFGLIPIPLKLRLHLLEPPYFTLQFGKKRVFLLKKKRTRTRIPPAGVRILRLDAKTTVGIEGAPAAAVTAAGTVSVLLAMLIPRIAEGGSVHAAMCASPMLRITLRADAIVFPAELVSGILRDRRIARRKAANNSRKSNEKRTNYASC